MPAPRFRLKIDAMANASPEVIDLLATTPSRVPFIARVRDLDLSPTLEKKILREEARQLAGQLTGQSDCTHLTMIDEKELAAEMLLLRHRFTECVFNCTHFRQAALTIVQNIYLFRNRRIFFGTSESITAEQERQQALYLLSTNPIQGSPSLAQTLQHLILARVWNRILCQTSESEQHERQFVELHSIVEKLNTLRNIYILLTTGLVKKLASRINDIYKESITFEDASQIGTFGIARAAYRYHHSSGIRFSTYAANWVFKEIQRQSLNGRLIRLSSNTIEQYRKATKSNLTEEIDKYSADIMMATPAWKEDLPTAAGMLSAEDNVESPLLSENLACRELRSILMQAIAQQLSEKAGDIIKRRYGLPPYQDQAQSVIAISQVYGVTRGSVYQLEQTSLKKLHDHLQKARLYC